MLANNLRMRDFD